MAMRTIVMTILVIVVVVAKDFGMASPLTQAAIVNYDFSVLVNSGPLIGNTYRGSFGYNDLGLTGEGFEVSILESGLFDYVTDNITRTPFQYDLVDDPTIRPAGVTFLDGVLLGVFAFGIPYAQPIGNPAFSINWANNGELLDCINPTCTTAIVRASDFLFTFRGSQVVPEPGTLSLLSCGILCLLAWSGWCQARDAKSAIRCQGVQG